MIITTAGRTNESMIQAAKKTAEELGERYLERKKRSIKSIQEIAGEDCIVVGKERLELFPLGEKEPFFFHPNSSVFRIKRLQNQEHDPFIEAAGIRNGKSLLDCTLGLASDSIVASYAAGGSGIVTGLEGNPYIAYLVKSGLQKWDSGHSDMNNAMRRIQVIGTDALAHLQTLPDNEYDCVYFDPMFEEKILESDGIKSLSQFAIYKDLTRDVINEALRVAKERVVLKDHFRSSRFEKYNFEVLKRKTAKFHYGVIEKK